MPPSSTFFTLIHRLASNHCVFIVTPRFGDGYTVILRVSGDQPDVTSVERFFSETFSDYELREKHHNMLQYQIGAHLLAKTFTSGVLPRVIAYFRFSIVMRVTVAYFWRSGAGEGGVID